MNTEHKSYCDNLKDGNVEVALLRCDVISGSNLIDDLSDQQIGYINFRANMNDIFPDELTEAFAFNAAKVVNTKLLEMMGYEL